MNMKILNCIINQHAGLHDKFWFIDLLQTRYVFDDGNEAESVQIIDET